jgi:outer membrane protein assembly factor BamB
MTTAHINEPVRRKPIRLWPGVVALLVQWILWAGVPLVAPDYAIVGILGGVAGGVVVLLWWLFFSRARWSERIAAVVVMVIAVLVTSQFVHLSISNGLMGRMPYLFSLPLLCLGLVVSVTVGRHLSDGARRAVMVVSILLACAAMTLVRTDGVSGAGGAALRWRWTPTAEERLLAQTPEEPIASVPSGSPGASAAPAPAAPKSEPVAPATPPPSARAEKSGTPSAPLPAVAEIRDRPRDTQAEWPGFRGPARDGVVGGTRIETDWARTQPVELWRRPIGPGWSSFVVQGDLVYTQEQRGDEEMVSCYRLSTGEPVWRHRDRVRFYESNGGPGPRATPALSHGRVYAMGATGVVNALDAATGALAWSRNAAEDTGAPMPGWGFAGSPLVVGDAVVAAASGRLVAYDAATGKPRWTRATGGGGYSSPHFMEIGGIGQVVLLSSGWATSVSPADGTILWQHQWAEGVSIVQPALVGNGELLIAAGDMMGGIGMRRLGVSKTPDGWNATARWTSRGLKPYFNDYVVHEGHAFGFDGTILSCINLEDGERKWKGGRYGAGQMLLLPDQDLLLVLSEDGELALVSATGDKHTEVARFKAIEGKTWNHPVLVGDVLLVRNGEEMAAFRLPRGAR